MRIDIRVDIKKLRRDIEIERGYIPLASKITIENLLDKSALAMRQEIQYVVDRPTPWTYNSIRILKRPTLAALYGMLGFKDMENVGGRGTPAGKYLQPLMEGTPRHAKGIEVLLRARGLLSNNEFVVPSKFQRLDAYGNVPRGVVQKIIANLDANRDRYSNTPAGGARRGSKKREYFFTRRGIRGARLTAIWWTSGAKGAHQSLPAFIVVDSPPKYRKRPLDLNTVVQREVNWNFKTEFEDAYARVKSGVR